MDKMIENHINKMPDEILLEIFSHLPVANIYISQFVCTRWMGIIKGEDIVIKDEDIFFSLAKYNQTNLMEKLCAKESSCLIAFCYSAVMVNNIDVLRWCIDQGCDLEDDACLFYKAVENQNLEMIKLLHENHCPRDENICYVAAGIGNLEILQWLKDHEYELGDKICDVAAEKNHLHILQWAKENKCVLSNNICIHAVENNNLEMLQWARENKCSWNSNVCVRAAAKSHFEILRWAIVNGCPTNDAKICSLVAQTGNIDLLQWLHYVGCYWDKQTCIEAARHGYFEILKWVIENGCPMDDPVICTIVTKYGEFELLKWLRQMHCPWDSYTCLAAASRNHHEILKWLINNGCPKNNPEICSLMAMFGRFDLLKWLYHVGCPWDAETYYHVKKFGNTDMIQWLLERGCPTWYQKIKEWLKAVTLGDLVKWGEKNQIPWNDELKCESDYSLESCYQVLKWAVNNGYQPKKISEKLFQCIVDKDHMVFLEWIVEMGCWDDHICDYAAIHKKFNALLYLADHGFKYNSATGVIIDLYRDLISQK